MGDSLKTLPALSSLPRLSATLASAPSCMRWAGAVVAHWQSSQLPVAHPDTCAPPWLWLRFPCTHCEPAQRPHWHTQWVPTRTPPDPHVEVDGSAEGSGSLTAATSAPTRDRTATVTHGLNVNMSPSNLASNSPCWVVCGPWLWAPRARVLVIRSCAGRGSRNLVAGLELRWLVGVYGGVMGAGFGGRVGIAMVGWVLRSSTITCRPLRCTPATGERYRTGSLNRTQAAVSF